MKQDVNLLYALPKPPESAVSLTLIKKTIFYLLLFFLATYVLSRGEVWHTQKTLRIVEEQLTFKRNSLEKLKVQNPTAEQNQALNKQIEFYKQQIAQQETFIAKISSNELSNLTWFVNVMSELGLASIPEIQVTFFHFVKSGNAITVSGMAIANLDAIRYFQNLKNYPEFSNKQYNDIALNSLPQGVSFTLSTSAS